MKSTEEFSDVITRLINEKYDMAYNFKLCEETLKVIANASPDRGSSLEGCKMLAKHVLENLK